MNKKKYIALILILSLFNVDKAFAVCTTEDKKEFRQYSNDFKVTYEFNLGTKDYTVTLNNPNPDKYRYVITEEGFLNKEKQTIGNKTVYTGISAGEYIIKVFENSGGCRTILKEIKIDMPKYNIYYEDPLCEGIEEFVLCQPTYKREIDRETFEYRIKDYKKKKLEEEELRKQQEELAKETLSDYIKNNLIEIIIIGTFVIMTIITIIVTVINSRESRRLE